MESVSRYDKWLGFKSGSPLGGFLTFLFCFLSEILWLNFCLCCMFAMNEVNAHLKRSVTPEPPPPSLPSPALTSSCYRYYKTWTLHCYKILTLYDFLHVILWKYWCLNSALFVRFSVALLIGAFLLSLKNSTAQQRGYTCTPICPWHEYPKVGHIFSMPAHLNVIKYMTEMSPTTWRQSNK